MSADRTDTCPACHEYGLKQYFEFTYQSVPYNPSDVQAFHVSYKAICHDCGWVHEASMVSSAIVPINACTRSDQVVLKDQSVESSRGGNGIRS